jgi:emopamil binding protein
MQTLLRSPYPKADISFLVCFVIFVLVAFVHEPLFYLYCGWDGLRDNTCTNPLVAAIWSGYAKFDPVYFDMPLWMALMIGFDSILLSPFYVYSVYALWTGKIDTPLYRALGYSVSGGLIYAMILYITWEVMNAEIYKTALIPVIAYNVPWGLVPLLLIFRLYFGGQRLAPVNGGDR